MELNQGQKKILIIDDIPENIRILLELLKKDYIVTAAKDGQKGLEMARQKPCPDLILLDIMMPRMDGYQVCRRLKEDTATSEIPVIFITSLTDEINEAEALEAGGIDFISKPIKPFLVRARVKNHLALRDAYIRLEEQNKALFIASRLKEDVDRISRHDLKGPLTSIIGFPEMMKDDENLTPKQKSMLEHIMESGLQMLDMINRSLDLYKMENGTYKYNPKSVDIFRILRKILADLHSMIKRNALEIRITLSGHEAGENQTLMLKGEELLLYSVFSNLIKNAIEASPENNDIYISIEEIKSKVRIIINNKGEVPEAIRDKFFHKYVTSGKKFGSGLGTYATLLAMKTMQAEISMSSSLQDGTSIILEFIS